LEGFTASVFRIEEYAKQDAMRMSVKIYKMTRCDNIAVCRIAR
jgi:hypothetical protein